MSLLFFGRLAGVLGLALLLLSALTSLRIPGLDRPFGGLTRVWRFHHLLGAGAFLLVMAHPLLLSLAAAHSSAQAAARVLFPSPGGVNSWVGWLSLAAMTVFLAPSFWFFGRPDYRRWKSLHAVSGLALAAGLTHTLSSGRSLLGAWGGRSWSAFGALALLAFAYRVFSPRRFGRAGYTITRVETIGRGTVELSLRPEGVRLQHRAGQFVYLTPLDPALQAGLGEEHPYTVSSAPGDPLLRLVIKDLGDATHALQTVAVGGKALVEGPYGGFLPARGASARELWIAGGVGLTPFLSRARALTEDERADIHLIYCVQDTARAHFLPELDAISARVPGLRVWSHRFEREGVLDAAFLRAHCPDLAAREIYVCGPPGLIAAARRELAGLGVSASRVRSEDFSWL